MATVVDENAAAEITWDDVQTKPRFPWDEWTDGNVYQVIEGVDFKSNSASFRMQLRKRAEATKKDLNVKTVKDDKSKAVSVFFQFV
jgi:hypothetical protein